MEFEEKAEDVIAEGDEFISILVQFPELLYEAIANDKTTAGNRALMLIT